MSAMKDVQINDLPYKIGRPTRGWWTVVVGLLVLVGLGIYAYSRQWIEGLGVTGMRDIGTMGGSTWGLYITFDIYFVGVSFAGISIAALIRLLNIKQLKPVSRMAELLTITALLVAGLVIMPDLGQPVRGLVNLFRYARPESPFFGTFTLVISGYLFSSLVYFYLDGRRDAAILAKVPGNKLAWFHKLWAAGYQDTPAERTRHRTTSFWLAIAILPLLVAAHSTLGFVFGLQVGRPGWFGAMQAPAFVIMAGISGVGMLMIIAAILRRVLSFEEKIKSEIFSWLGGLMAVLILIYLYFMITEWLTASYTAALHEVSVSQALIMGDYAWIFWISVVALVLALVNQILPFVPLPAWIDSIEVQKRSVRFTRVTAAGAAALLVVMVLQIVPATQTPMTDLSPTLLNSIPWILAGLGVLTIIFFAPVMCRDIFTRSVVSGLLVNLAAIGKRYLIVVPSQTHGTLLPYGEGFYRPTWVEYGVVIGLFALGALLYTLFIKVFPIMEVEDHGDRPKPIKADKSQGMGGRGIIAWGLVIGGFVVQTVAYFFLSAPLGIPVNESFSNPRVEFAPTLFIIGVMVVFIAAILYEVLPEKQRA